MKRFIEIEEAGRVILKTDYIPTVELVPLHEAQGRILAEDLYSPMDLPPFNRSPLDGYAIFHEDSMGASPENPVELQVTGRAFAGDPPSIVPGIGEAVRIMTGGRLPRGTDCVIKQEDTDYGSATVKIRRQMMKDENVCFQGEEIACGAKIIDKHSPIGHGEIGVLAGLGIARVPVYRAVRVGILCTGSEIIEPGIELEPGKIYNSNGYAIAARLRELGAEAVLLEDTVDEKERIKERIRANADKFDLLITTGGVSVGETDYIVEVVNELGGRIEFLGVEIKPGSSMAFSIYREKPVISLSGNPSAAMVTFELFVRPLIAEMARDSRLKLVKMPGILLSDFSKPSPVRRMIRARSMFTSEGIGLEIIRNKQSSGMISASLGSNCLVDIPSGTGILNTGMPVDFIPLDIPLQTGPEGSLNSAEKSVPVYVCAGGYDV